MNNTKAKKNKAKKKKKGIKRRYFKYSYSGSEFKGRYFGRKPKQAGLKALKRIVLDNKLQPNKNVLFKLRECTRGSKKKTFFYVGKRVKLKKPVKVNIGGNEIVYKYTNELKKYKKQKKIK